MATTATVPAGHAVDEQVGFGGGEDGGGVDEPGQVDGWGKVRA
jgi:hypothetical protein